MDLRLAEGVGKRKAGAQLDNVVVECKAGMRMAGMDIVVAVAVVVDYFVVALAAPVYHRTSYWLDTLVLVLGLQIVVHLLGDPVALQRLG